MAALVCAAMVALAWQRAQAPRAACGPDDARSPVPGFIVDAPQAPGATIIASFFGPGTALRGDHTDAAGNLFLGAAERAADAAGTVRFDKVTLCTDRLARLALAGQYRVRLNVAGDTWVADLPDMAIGDVAGSTIALTLRPAAAD